MYANEHMSDMLLALQQLRPAKSQTLQALCPVVSASKMLAPDPLSPVSVCEVESPWIRLVLYRISQMLDWIEIWGPGQHLCDNVCCRAGA